MKHFLLIEMLIVSMIIQNELLSMALALYLMVALFRIVIKQGIAEKEDTWYHAKH